MNPVGVGLPRSLFLERPGKFSGPKSNIQIKILYQGFQLVSRRQDLWGNLFLVKGSLAYLRYAWQANFSFIFLQNLENR